MSKQDYNGWLREEKAAPGNWREVTEAEADEIIAEAERKAEEEAKTR